MDERGLVYVCETRRNRETMAQRGVSESRRVMSVTGTALTAVQTIPMRSCVNKRHVLVAEVNVI